MESSAYGSTAWQAYVRSVMVAALHAVVASDDRYGVTAPERIAVTSTLATAVEQAFGQQGLVVRQHAAERAGPVDYEAADPYREADGWRSAADCARCGDTGRVREAYPSALRQTPETIAYLRRLYVQAYGQADDHRIEAGLSAVLEIVLRPQIVAGFCRCKKGRRLAETPRGARPAHTS